MIQTGIYKITCLITNKVYIGQTGVSFKKRWSNHRSDLNTNKLCKKNPKFQNAWNKYGEDNFKFKILELVHKHKDLLAERENYWINFYDSVKSGYNSIHAVNSCLGCKQSESTKRKLAKATKENWLNKDIRDKRCKALIGHKTYERTEDQNEAVRKANIGNKYCLGRKMSEETKKKISLARQPFIEQVRALGKSNKGRRKSCHL